MKGIMAPLLAVLMTGMVTGQQPHNHSNEFSGSGGRTNPPLRSQAPSPAPRSAPASAAPANQANQDGPLELVLTDELLRRFRTQRQLVAPVEPREHVNEIKLVHDPNQDLKGITGTMTPVSKSGDTLFFELDDYDLELLKQQGLKYSFDAFEKGRYRRVQFDYRPVTTGQKTEENRSDIANRERGGASSTWPARNETAHSQQPRSNECQFDRNANASSRPLYDPNFMGPIPPPQLQRIGTQYERPPIADTHRNSDRWSPQPNPGNELTHRFDTDRPTNRNESQRSAFDVRPEPAPIRTDRRSPIASSQEPVHHHNDSHLYRAPERDRLSSDRWSSQPDTAKSGSRLGQYERSEQRQDWNSTSRPTTDDRYLPRRSDRVAMVPSGYSTDSERDWQRTSELATPRQQETFRYEQPERRESGLHSYRDMTYLRERPTTKVSPDPTQEWASELERQRDLLEQRRRAAEQAQLDLQAQKIRDLEAKNQQLASDLQRPVDRTIERRRYALPSNQLALDAWDAGNAGRSTRELGQQPLVVPPAGQQPITGNQGVRDYRTQISGPSAAPLPRVAKRELTPPNQPDSSSNHADPPIIGQNATNTGSKTGEQILYFLLLCSLGLNLYLGWIARGFYLGYSELADELRETFTATM